MATRKVFHFDESGQITVPSGYTCNLSTNGWVRFIARVDSDASVSGKSNNGFIMADDVTAMTDALGLNLCQATSANVLSTVRLNTTNYSASGLAEDYRDDTEHTWLITWDGTNTKAYVDGTLKLTSSDYSGAPGEDIGDTETLTIGGFDAAHTSGRLKGWVRDFEIHNGVAYPTESLSHFWAIDDNSNTIVDSEGSINGTLAGGTGSWEDIEIAEGGMIKHADSRRLLMPGG